MARRRRRDPCARLPVRELLVGLRHKSLPDGDNGKHINFALNFYDYLRTGHPLGIMLAWTEYPPLVHTVGALGARDRRRQHRLGDLGRQSRLRAGARARLLWRREGSCRPHRRVARGDLRVRVADDRRPVPRLHARSARGGGGCDRRLASSADSAVRIAALHARSSSRRRGGLLREGDIRALRRRLGSDAAGARRVEKLASLRHLRRVRAHPDRALVLHALQRDPRTGQQPSGGPVGSCHLCSLPLP